MAGPSTQEITDMESFKTLVKIADLNGFVIDYQMIAVALKPFLVLGSGDYVIRPEEIYIPATKRGTSVTLKELLNSATKLFDALVFLAMAPADRAKCGTLTKATMSTLVNDKEQASMDKIANYVTICFLHLLSRSNYPSGTSTELGSAIPQFQKTVLGNQMSGDEICQQLANFNLSKINNKWIETIKLTDLGDKFRNRIALSPAGHRQLAPFRYLKPLTIVNNPITEEDRAVTKAYRFLKDMQPLLPNWAIHPSTRDTSFQIRFGTFAKECSNLMVKCFSDEDLDAMVKARIIFQKPVWNPQHMEFMNWDTNLEFLRGRMIFGADYEVREAAGKLI